MTKLQTIKNLLEDDFSGKLKIDAGATSKDVKDHTRASSKYDRLNMEQKLMLLRKQHNLGRRAIETLPQSSMPKEKKDQHIENAIANYEHLKNLSISITRQLEQEESELKSMLGDTTTSTDEPKQGE